MKIKIIYVQLFLFLLALPFSNVSFALDEQIRNYRGIRSAGMGGLITTTGNYGEALFGNPARHSEVDTWKLTLIDPTVEVNDNLIQSTKEISNLKSSSGANTISSASKLIGQNQHARVQLMPAFYHPKFIGDLGFAFGLLVSAQTNLAVRYTTNIDTQTILDAGPAIGFSHPFFNDRLKVGINLRMLYRVSTTGTLSSLNFLSGQKLSFENFGNQGVGFDGDFGFFYHVPWEPSFMRVKFGASINNIAKSHYNYGTLEVIKGAGRSPYNNDRTVSTGLRFDFPDFFIFTAPLVAFEVQDIGDTTSRMSFYKKTHMGLETKLTRFFAFRAGLNQGYWSAGLGIDLPVLKIDVASYGEELSPIAGGWEDRRYIVRVAFEF